MEYFKLILGIVLIVAFTWLLFRNSKRSGFLHTLFRIDTLIGIIAGLYLIITSILALSYNQ